MRIGALTIFDALMIISFCVFLSRFPKYFVWQEPLLLVECFIGSAFWLRIPEVEDIFCFQETRKIRRNNSLFVENFNKSFKKEYDVFRYNNSKYMIGIFDSGFGGLTTVRELRRILPQYDILFGRFRANTIRFS